MKRRLLIPIFIMILTFSTVLASWIIINQKDSYLESEYFPFEVSSEQTKIFNGQNQSIDIDFDDLNVTLDQSNLTVEYYKVTEVKNNGKTEYVLGNKMATSPRNQGTYYVKILAELTNDAGETVTEEVSSVKFVIARRCVKVIPASYSAYFAQSLDYKTTDSNSLAGYTFVENEYFYENVTTTTGLLETHSITKTSNFGIEYKKVSKDTISTYDIYSGVGTYETWLSNNSFDILDSEGNSELDNYTINYDTKGTLTINALPLSFTWNTASLTVTYNGQYRRPTVTFTTSVAGVDADALKTAIENSPVDIITNKEDSNGRSYLCNVTDSCSDLTCLSLNNENYTLAEDYPSDPVTFTINPYKINVEWSKDNSFTYDGQYHYVTASITTPLLNNAKNNNTLDVCDIVYADNGKIDSNVNTSIVDGVAQFTNGDAYYSVINGLSNNNYVVENIELESVHEHTYFINPLRIVFTWDTNNTFEYDKNVHYIDGQFDETILVTRADNSTKDTLGLAYNDENAKFKANYVDLTNKNENNTDIYYAEVTIENSNYYLSTYRSEYKIYQKEITLTWDKVTDFTYAGKFTSSAKDTIKYQYAKALIPSDSLCVDDNVVVSYDANTYQYEANYNTLDNTKVKVGDTVRGDYLSTAILTGDDSSNYKIKENNNTCSYRIFTSVQTVNFKDYSTLSRYTVTEASTFGLARNTLTTISYLYDGKNFTPEAMLSTSLDEQEMYEDSNVTVVVGLTDGTQGASYVDKVRDAGIYQADTRYLSNPNYVIKNVVSVAVEVEQRPFEIEWVTSLVYAGNDVYQTPTASIKSSFIQTNEEGVSDVVSITVDSTYKQINANADTNGDKLSGKEMYDVALTKNADGYIISGKDAKNYRFATEEDKAIAKYNVSAAAVTATEFIIKQVALTISSIETSITYGDNPTAKFGDDKFTVDGLVKRDEEIISAAQNNYRTILTGLSYDITYEQYKDVTDVANNVTYSSVWEGVTNTNYAITYNSAAFIVNKKNVTIEWDSTNTTHIYDGQEWAPTVQINGLVNNDQVLLTRTDGKINTNIFAGNASYTAKVDGTYSTDGKYQEKNYNVTNLTDTIAFTITQRPVTINWTKTTNTYNSQSWFPTYVFNNVVGEDELQPVETGAKTDANQKINGTLISDVYTASINSLGNLNYKLAETSDINAEMGITDEAIKTINFYIKAAPVSINWTYANSAYTYLGVEQKPTASIEGNIYDTDLSSVVLSSEVSSNSTIVGFIAGVWAGDHTVTASLSGARSFNYEITENQTEEYKISKAPLTITANGNTIVYGDAPTNKGYTYAGFVNGETIAVLNGSIDYSYSYSQYQNIGSNYLITPKGYSHNNYDIKYNTGTLVVNARPVTIAWTVGTYTYNGTEQAPIANVSNTVNGDVVAVEVSKFINASIGSAQYTSQVLSLGNENYTLNNQTFEQQFTIQPKPVTVVWSNYTNLTYSARTQIPTISFDDGSFLSRDNVECSVALASGNGIDAASYTANATLSGEGSTNYVLSETSKEYSIAKLTITVDWQDDLTFKFTGSVITPVVEITNLQTNENGNIDICTFTLVIKDSNGNELTSGASEVGTYYAVISGLSNTNYELPAETLRGISFIIRSFSITITIHGITITYGTTVGNIVFDYTPSGELAEGESFENLITGKLTFDTTYKQFAAANTYYSISNPSGLTAGDYDVEYVVEGGSANAIKVDPATITSINWSTLTYNGQIQKPTATFSLLTGDTGVNTVDVVSPDSKSAGEYTATSLTSNNSNYVLSNDISKEYTIAPKEIELNWSSVNNVYTFIGSAVTIATPTISTSLYGEDIVNVSIPQGARNANANPSGDYLSDTRYSVTATLTGADADNYAISTESISFDYIIKQANVTITWGSQNIFEYAGQSASFSPEVSSISGVIAGTDCVAVRTSTPQTNANAYGKSPSLNSQFIIPGMDVYKATAGLSGADANNYVINNDTYDFIITRAIITITWTNTVLTYCGENIVPTINHSDFFDGDIGVISCEILQESINANSDYNGNLLTGKTLYKTKAILEGNSNYELSNVDVEFKILPYGIDVVWNDDLVYNGLIQIPAIVTNPIKNTISISEYGFTFKDGINNTNRTIQNAMTYNNIIPLISNTNYYINSYENRSFTIVPLKVNVNATILPLNYSIGYTWINSTISDSLLTVLKSGITFTPTNYNGDDYKISGDYQIVGMHNGLYGYGDAINIDGIVKSPSTYLIGSTYNVTVKAISNNIEIDKDSNYFILKYKTAKIGETYYTIEDAITSSGDITFVGNLATATDINSYIATSFCNLTSEQGYPYQSYSYTLNNRKLVVPFNSSGSNKSQSENSNTDSYVYSSLIITNKVSLYLTGSSNLVSAAEIRYYQKSVDKNLPDTTFTGTHGVIMNYGTIDCASGTTIYAYGYIKGTGTINLRAGATAMDCIKTFDWVGGTALSKIFENVFPANAWVAHNISCDTYIYKNAEYKIWIYAVAGGFDIEQEGTIIGKSNSTNCVFKPNANDGNSTDLDYILKKSNPANTWSSEHDNYDALDTITGSNQIMGQKDEFVIDGSYVDNEFSISKNYIIINVTLKSSKSISMPFGYTDVTVKNGSTLNLLNADYSCMPGTSINIETGATVNVGTDVDIALLKWDNVSSYTEYLGGFGAHCIDKEDAYLTCNGTLTTQELDGKKGSIGGTIFTNGSNANLKVVNSIASYTMLTSSKEGEYYISNIVTPSGIKYGETDLSAFTIGTYISKEGKWYSEYCNIYYDPNGGELTGVEMEGPYKVGDNGYAVSGVTTSNPIRTHYIFDGWYFDKECTDPVQKNNEQDYRNIYTNIYVYAKWIPKDYTLEYLNVYDEEITNPSGSVSNSNKTTFNIQTKENFSEATHSLNYVFGGWYLDEGCTIRISTLNGADLLQNSDGTNTVVKLYALWYPAETKTYTIKYTNTNLDVSCVESETYVIKNSSQWSNVKLPIFTMNDLNNNQVNVNNLISYSKYFVGWKIKGTETYVTEFTEENSSTIFTDRVVELETVWSNKHLLNIKVSKFDFGVDKGTIETTMYYIPNIKLNFTKADYLPEGYAYKATINNEDKGFTLGQEFDTTGLTSGSILAIELHNIITVTLTVTGGSDYKNPSFVIGQYVDSNNKIVSSSKTYSSSTTVNVIFGTSFTISAKASGIKSFYIYVGDKEYSGSLWGECKQQGTITSDINFKIKD